MIADTPAPPYYAVIFTSLRTQENQGYSDTAEKMMHLVKEQDGFLGVESVREELGITISYWKDLESIQKWKENMEHKIAKETGKAFWYTSFKTRIAKVEKDYDFE